MQSAIVPKANVKEVSEGPMHSSGPEGLGYTLWRFDGSKWQIKKNCPVDGAVASPAPTFDGEFEGQLRATACVLAG
ncbi:MAG: hypothetical protein AAGG48_11270 [Planctomycetota bacterium]